MTIRDDVGKGKTITWIISIAMNFLIIITFIFVSTPNSAIKIFKASTRMNKVTDDMAERSDDWVVVSNTVLMVFNFV